MNTIARLILFAACCCGLLSSVRAADSTLYVGECRNVTYGLDGLVKLFIIEKGQSLEGYMSISGWLVGSGPLKGARDDKKFRFETQDPVWGLSIKWQGTLDGTSLTGEYFCAPNATLGTGRQVGEWAVKVKDRQKDGVPESEASFRELFMLRLEGDLNAPVKNPDGSAITGAQSLFNSVHPIGTGVSVNVEDVDIDWKPDTKKKAVEDIHKFKVSYVIYWHGIIKPTGWTRLQLAYNNEINAITNHEVIESTGTTRTQVENIAFGIGALLGEAAVESLLNSN